MSDIAVWAPLATCVQLQTASGERLAMRSDAGWWHDSSHYRGEYLLVVDGAALPDPRSAHQPAGVPGPSATIDHGAFVWSDQAWRGCPLEDAVIYEIHVPTFSDAGTFDGAIDHLDHLVDLGVTAVEVMPVATFPGTRGWGYDGVLIFAPHHAFGGPDGLKRFVDAAHRRGLAVVLDVVYNHFGPSGNHLGQFGPYFTDKYSTPWGEAVNLDDSASNEVRSYFIANALQWIRDYHIDGLRLDAVHALHDESAIPFLEQLAAAVHAVGTLADRDVWVIAESDLNDPRLVDDVAVGGLGLDAAWSDDFHHAVHAVLAEDRSGYYSDFGSLADLAKALERVFVFDGIFSPLRNRDHGRPVGDLPRHHFIGFTQNHDQIGNRAVGERLAHLIGFRRAQIAAALLLTAPYVPLLFQGEEWASSSPFQYMTDHSDADLAEAIRSGRAKEFATLGWDPSELPDPQDVATLDRSRLAWDELDGSGYAEMLDWYRSLLRLRRTEPDLRDASPEATCTQFDEEGRWMVVVRGSFEMIFSLAAMPVVVPLSRASREIVLSNDPDGVVLADDSVELLPDGVVVLCRTPG